MFSKIFANICVCLVTQNALQHLSFFFLPIFGQIDEDFFYVFPGDPRLDFFSWTHLKISVCRYCWYLCKMRAASSNINRHSNKHARCSMHSLSKKMRKTINKLSNRHCVKSVRIWSYSGQHFPCIFPNLDWIRSPYSVRMRENAGKCGPE